MIARPARATPIAACRACGGAPGVVFCDLGVQPVSNSYIPPEQAAAPEPVFPLRAVVCGSCRLVQLDTEVDAEGIFSDYAYFSSYSDSWVEHARRFAMSAQAALGLGPESLVVGSPATTVTCSSTSSPPACR